VCIDQAMLSLMLHVHCGSWGEPGGHYPRMADTASPHQEPASQHRASLTEQTDLVATKS
jgi:hypothetical protein